jgi:hypothetical protein
MGEGATDTRSRWEVQCYVEGRACLIRAHEQPSVTALEHRKSLLLALINHPLQILHRNPRKFPKRQQRLHVHVPVRSDVQARVDCAVPQHAGQRLGQSDRRVLRASAALWSRRRGHWETGGGTGCCLIGFSPHSVSPVDGQSQLRSSAGFTAWWGRILCFGRAHVVCCSVRDDCLVFASATIGGRVGLRRQQRKQLDTRDELCLESGIASL